MKLPGKTKPGASKLIPPHDSQTCETCQWWRDNPDGEGECFEYLWGNVVWDVAQAHRIIEENPRPAVTLSLDKIQELMWMCVVDESHALSVSLHKPVLLSLVQLVLDTKPPGYVLMDGHHRCFRALHEKKTIQAYLMTLEESDSCLLKHPMGVPPKYRKPRKKK